MIMLFQHNFYHNFRFITQNKSSYQECKLNVHHSHLKSVDGGHTANTAPPSTTTGAAELFIHDNIAYGNPQHLHLNTITTDAAEIQICDNISYGNLQTNINPEYERLDQLVHTGQDKNKMDCSDNTAFGNLQPMHTLQPIHTNTNPEYERLDQLACTYETLDQDEDKPEHHGASTPSD